MYHEICVPTVDSIRSTVLINKFISRSHQHTLYAGAASSGKTTNML
jgi:hypothetical protein